MSSAHRFICIILVLWCGISIHVRAETVLNKLSNCSGIKDSFVRAEMILQKGAVQCRPPRTHLEAILVRASSSYGTKVCLDPEDPPKYLKGFSCTSRKWTGGGMSLCFREVNFELIDALKVDSLPARRASRSYLKAAASCNNSSMDVAESSHKQMPLELNSIAEFELGFNSSPIEIDGLAGSFVSHGFATLNPALAYGRPQGIEYLSVLLNGIKPNQILANRGTKFEESGWNIEINPLEVIFTNYAMDVFITEISLSKNSDENKSYSSLDIFEHLIDDLNSSLDNIAADSRSVEELESETGFSMKEIFNQMIPYGMKRKNNIRFLVGDYFLLDEGHYCMRQGGGIVVVSNAADESADVRSYFGSVSMAILAIAPCTVAYGAEINPVLHDIKGVFEHSVKNTLRNY